PAPRRRVGGGAPADRRGGAGYRRAWDGSSPPEDLPAVRHLSLELGPPRVLHDRFGRPDPELGDARIGLDRCVDERVSRALDLPDVLGLHDVLELVELHHAFRRIELERAHRRYEGLSVLDPAVHELEG